jgi:hypothetical protein
VDVLADALRQSDPVSSQTYVEYMCAVAFQSGKAPDSAAALSLQQRRALIAIEEADAFWRGAAGSGINVAAQTLSACDLPTKREGLRAYLDAPSSPPP